MLLVLSCQTNNDILIPQNNTTISETSSVKLVNGYLRFANRDVFSKTIDSISKLSEFERLNWEKSIGFTSQTSIINEVKKDEIENDSLNNIKYANTLLKILEEYGYESSEYKNALTKVDKNDFHSKTYFNALNKSIIKETEVGTENETWDVSNQDFTNYIGEDGMFAIGDSIFKVQDNEIIAPSSESKLTRSKLQALSSSLTSPGIITKTASDNKWINPNRIVLAVELTTVELLTSNSAYSFRHGFSVKSQYKNLFGNWVYENDWPHLIIKGEWTVSVYKYPQIYENSYSFDGYSNMYERSINPETGQVLSTSYFFTVSPTGWNLNYDYNTQAYYHPTYQKMQWTATRLDRNLTATITY